MCGMQFKKDESEVVTYTSGGSNITIDYLMIHYVHIKLLQKCKKKRRFLKSQQSHNII